MFMRGMFRKMAGEAASSADACVSRQAEQSIALLNDTERLAMLDSFERCGIAWFWATDALNRLIYLSSEAEKTFAQDTDLRLKPLTDLFEVTNQWGEAAVERPLKFYLGSHTRFSDLVARLDCAGSEVWWSISGRPQFDENENFLGFRGSAKDISDQFIRNRDESRMAQFDALTGLANRHRMQSRLDVLLPSFVAARRSCALLMMDLDKFKHVNDTLGHPAGDELLRQVAQRLQRIIVAPAEISRLGGDEFQIMIPDMDDRGQLGELANKIIQMVSQPYSLEGQRATIGASLGIAIAPYDGVNRLELVKSADLALYASKGGGRGQYRFYAADLANAAKRQQEIGTELREALGSDQLDIHYQPIVRTSDNKVIAFEALIRWNHPEMGAISPSSFWPVAEELGLQVAMGDWALERACQDAMQWPGEIGVSVNVSVQQFFSGTLPATVSEILTRSGLRPGRLELEITEGVFMGETQMVDATFAKLGKLGVELALDDFGKGHSSLAFMRRAPFSKIKINKEFVRGCCEPENPNAAIITAIISLAGALDMDCSAEGVEAMDELEILLARGVSQIQGFVFSRPRPQEEVLSKLLTGDFIYEPAGPARHRAERRTQFRRIGVIHENFRYEAILRNLSATGALIEGLLDVPVGTDLLLDLGGGQLAVATVRRSQDASQGVEFETPLISDGANGLCTRHRVSPYQMASVGIPVAALDAETGAANATRTTGRRRFMQLDVSAGSSRAA